MKLSTRSTIIDNQLWSWLLTAIGLLGFFLAGKKVWWAWYVNIANQVFWFAYAWITQQWGFIVGTLVYSAIFIRNAYLWTSEHREKKSLEQSDPNQFVK